MALQFYFFLICASSPPLERRESAHLLVNEIEDDLLTGGLIQERVSSFLEVSFQDQTARTNAIEGPSPGCI